MIPTKNRLYVTTVTVRFQSRNRETYDSNCRYQVQSVIS